jgi:hypothetical protein
MLKNSVLLMSIAALLALAIPAASHAEANWTHEGGSLTGEPEFEMTGSLSGTVAGTSLGWHSVVHLKLKLQGGGDGTLTAFHTTACTGTGALNGLPCTASPSSPTLPSWPATATKDGTVLVNIEGLHQIAYANPAHTIPVVTILTSGRLVLTPDDSSGIYTADLSGEDLTANGNLLSVEGELEVIGDDAGTYGIE